MVSVTLVGRSGNQLFQKACAIGYAIKHGLDYDISESRKEGEIIIGEKSFEYEELPFKEEWRNKDILISGYRQSWKYFNHCNDEILKIFGEPYLIRPMQEFVSCHVRRGDYLTKPTKHPVLPEEYYKKAIYQFYPLGRQSKFLICSDDINWCKSHFNDKNYSSNIEFIFSMATDLEKRDLYGMAHCHSNIIANSSFSWWSQFLNQNPEKKVIAPSKDKWFGKDMKHNVNDLYMDNWIQL